MEKRLLSIQEFHDLLRQWKGNKIKVVKHELQDIDETLINLSRTSYSQEPKSMDGYEPQYALHLDGAGTVVTDNEQEDLPSNRFEIPLEENALYEFDGERFIISTSRGVYTLERLES